MSRALAFLAGIVFGLVLGYLAATYLASRRPAEEPSRSREARAVSERSEPRERSTEADDVSTADPVVASDAEGLATLADALAAITVDRVRGGNGSITGRITDESGSGVGGVVIRGYAKRDRASASDGGPPVRKSLETKVRDVVEAHHYGRALDAETTTAADGRYTLSGIGDARYSVRAYREGYELSAANWQRASDAAAGDEIDFRAKRKFGIEVAVRLPDGSVPDRASIRAIVAQISFELDWTPESPRLQLESGVYGLVALAGERQEFASREVRVSVGERGSDDSVTLDLVARNGILGEVSIPEGEGSRQWISVRIMKTVDGVMPSPEQLTGEGRQAVVHEFDPEFSFYDIAPGTYAVGVARGNETIRDVESVIVANDVVRVDLTLPSLAESGAIVLYAYAPDGSELTSGVTATVEVREANGASFSTQVTVSARPEGGHWLALDAAVRGNGNVGDFEDAVTELTVVSAKYGAETTTVRVGEDSEITVRFTDPAELLVTLAGYAGSGHEGELVARLGESNPNQSVAFRAEQSFDVEGRMRLGPVQPGSYQVELRTRTGERYWSRLVSSTPVTLVSGTNEITLEIPALYTLIVRVPEGSKSRSFSLANEAEESWSGASAEVNDAGQAVFRKVAAGTYTLMDESDMMSGVMTVRIPDQLDVSFEPAPVNALRVTITDPDGGLAEAGFRDGDIVIGLDGKEFTSMMELQMRLMASMTQESSSLLVSRNGATIEIDADLRGMSDPASMGGRMSPRSR